MVNVKQMKFRGLNIKSPGLISTFLMVLFISSFMFYATFNVYRNNGSWELGLGIFSIGFIPILLFIFKGFSTIEIVGSTLKLKYITHTKTIDLKQYKKLFITSTVPGSIYSLPHIEELEQENIPKEKWYTFLSVRQIQLSKKVDYEPAKIFNNKFGIVSLAYYPELLEELKIIINTNHNKL